MQGFHWTGSPYVETRHPRRSPGCGGSRPKRVSERRVISRKPRANGVAGCDCTMLAIRVNAEHYFSKAIENLFAAEERRFADIIDAVTDSPGDKKQFVKSLWVYGSVARGEDRLGSDLDVGVVTGSADLAAVVDVVRDSIAIHSERLGFTPSVVSLDMEDVSRLARDDDPWWASVVKDAIVLAGRRPEELPALAGAAADG